MGVAQLTYEPQLQTITGLTAGQEHVNLLKHVNTVKMPFTSSHPVKGILCLHYLAQRLLSYSSLCCILALSCSSCLRPFSHRFVLFGHTYLPATTSYCHHHYYSDWLCLIGECKHQSVSLTESL